MTLRILRKTLPAVLAAALVFSFSGYTLAAPRGFSDFSYSGEYVSGQFHDVDETDWFARYVEGAFNYGFIQGKGADTFDPDGLLTLGEAVKLAARLRSIYYTGAADFVEGVPYYAVYARYALTHGIISSHGDYTAPADRACFAELIYNALPSEAFEIINDIPDYAISDVAPAPGFGAAAYTLYRAGILTGADRFGAFFPHSFITRAEACAVMVRLADPAARQNAGPAARIPASVIYERNVNAVIMFETFDVDDESIRTGSGFFISNAGYAITNLHVIDNAARATATFYNGDVLDVLGVLAVSEEFNLAMVAVGLEGGSCDYLILADSDLIETGNTVYALGSPLSLINSMSSGIIGNTAREVSGETLIQFTAAISFGSGGSPLLNTRGQVVGVTSSSFSYGQNLNLAVPINHVKSLTPGECIPLEEFLLLRASEEEP